MIIPETIPEMRARYERQIADLQGQIERLRMDLQKAERDADTAYRMLLAAMSEQATTP